MSDLKPQPPTKPTPDTKTKPGKPKQIWSFLLWSLAALIVIAMLSSLFLPNWISLPRWKTLLPLLGTMALPLAIAFVLKFIRDNQSLVAGCTPYRFVSTAFLGLVRFIPGLLILSVAFAIILGADKAIEWGLKPVKDWAESVELITVSKPTLVPRHPLSPWRLFGSPEKIVIEEIQIPEDSGKAMKFAVGTAISFVSLLLIYPWLLLSFFTIKSYFYFWSRAFVAAGGQVTMQFPKYQK